MDGQLLSGRHNHAGHMGQAKSCSIGHRADHRTKTVVDGGFGWGRFAEGVVAASQPGGRHSVAHAVVVVTYGR